MGFFLSYISEHTTKTVRANKIDPIKNNDWNAITYVWWHKSNRISHDSESLFMLMYF